MLQQIMAQAPSSTTFAATLAAQLAATVAKAQSKRRLDFAPYLEAFLTLFFDVVVRSPPLGGPFDLLLLAALRFLRSVVRNSAVDGYRADMWRTPVDGPMPATLVQCDAVVRTFFSPAVLGKFLDVMIRSHLVLREEDVREMTQDPESFLERENEVDAWRYSRRACIEAVFLAVVDRFPVEFARPLIELLASALDAVPTSPAVVLAKDAAYTAIGLAAYDLVAELHLAQAIPRWISELAAVSDPVCAVVLRRRVAWLLGTVVAAGLDNPPLPSAYQCLSTLLTDADLSVAFTAAASLHSLVDSLSFNAAEFLPHVQVCLAALFSLLLVRSREVSSRLRLLSAVTVIIQQTGEGIAPVAQAVADALSRVWLVCASPSETVVRGQVLAAFSALVEATCTVPGCLVPLLLSYVLPLIAHSRTPQAAEPILLEDALELCSALVCTSPEFTEDMLTLCTAARLPEVFSQTCDSLRLSAACEIARALFVCGGAHFLALPCASSLLIAMLEAIDGLAGDGVACVLRPLEVMLRLPSLPPMFEALVIKLVSMSSQ
jgi:hypothetical protein